MITTELFKDAKCYWLNAIDLNPDAGILSTLRVFMEDRPETITETEFNAIAFEILIDGD